MNVETLHDVLEWTRNMHHNLAAALKHGYGQAKEERLRMVMEYLAAHERELERVLRLVERDATPSAMKTWVADYFDRHPVRGQDRAPDRFNGMDSAGILNEVLAMHREVIDLYRYLYERADVSGTREMLASLLQLEEHEAMRMVRDVERMEDL